MPYVEGESLRQKLARPYVWGSHTQWRARIASALGDRDWRWNSFAKLIGTEGVWVVLHRDIDFEYLRDFPPFQEFLRPKG